MPHVLQRYLDELCHPWVPEQTRAARERIAEPWRVAVVGRVGVGKTTLVNRLVHSDRPTGLGGVTKAVFEASGEGRVWLDTPGIDGEHEALVTLGPVIADADAVVWIVDALQPATRTERVVLDTLLDGQPLVVLASRGDLLPAKERQQVAQRLEGLVGHHTLPIDLRTEAFSLDATEPQPTSRRRTLVVQQTLQAALVAHQAAPPPIDCTEALARLRSSWSRAVRAAAEHVRPLVETGEIESTRALVDALRHQLPKVLNTVSETEGLQRALEHHGPPNWPGPPQRPETPLGRVAASMGGATRASRVLNELAAEWLLAGELAAADWVRDATLLDQTLVAWQTERDRLETALAAVTL